MNKKRGGLLLIAFGLIAAAAVGYMVLQVTKQAAAQKVETVNVVVALQDVPERTVLSPTLVGVREALANSLPPGAITRPDQVNGRMTTTRLYAGETILSSRLADTSGKSGVSYTIDPGKVLETLSGSDIIGVNAIRPGDHVDILAVLMPTEQQSTDKTTMTTVDDEVLPTTTQFALQNLVVVGVGPFAAATAGKDGQPAPSGGAAQASNSLITFALSHDDALQLKLLKDHKRVRLEVVLRAAGDDEIVRTNPVTLQTILDRYGLRTAKP